MKLLLDMNLPSRLSERLREAGFDSCHWSQVGIAQAPDPELMSWARTNSAIVISQDLDFSAILAASGAAGPSVVQIRSDDLTVEVLLGPLVAALHQMETELQQGAILSLDIESARIRMLPLRSAR